MFADVVGRDEESEAVLLMMGVGGGAATEALADDCGVGMCVVAGADLGFTKGAALAAGVFLKLAVFPQSFGSSLLSVFFPFLLPLCFSLLLFRSLRPAESSPLPLSPDSLLPP